MKLRVVIHPAEKGGYWAEVPGFPGCVSCGDTLEETRVNILDAFEGVFEVMQETAEPDPEFQTSEDIMQVFEV
jgi:predicted RNase H-like HicB family nuclease